MKNKSVGTAIVKSWQALAAVVVLSTWVSISLVSSHVNAAGGVPIIVRNAVLVSPTGSVNPHGAAEWQLYSDGNRELEVEIEDTNLSQGASLNAVIDGNPVGAVIIDDRGKGKLKLKTEDGQMVPSVGSGATVQVRNGASVLVAGTFGGGPGPSPSVTPTGTPSPSPSVSPSGSPSPSPSPTSTPGGTILIVRNAVLASPSGSVNPHGASEWQLYSNGNRELEVEIEDTNLAQGTALSAYIDGNNVGPLVIDDRGKGKLKLRSEDGQSVPTVNAGAAIQVRNGSTVLVAGVFGGSGPTPSPSVSPTGSPSPSPSPSVSPSPSPSPASGDLFAGLTGPTINGSLPNGYATYEIHSSRTELEVRIRQVNLAIGTVLAVSVDGLAVGNMSTQSGGEGRLRLRSDDGQIVPMIAVGAAITIKNGEVLVLSGTFNGFGTPTPTPTGTPGGTPTPSPSPSPSPGPAQGRSFEAHLTGAQVTPAVSTTGNGEIKVTLNTAETEATVFGEFHNLSSDQTGARIETAVGTITTIRDLGIVGGRNGNFESATFAVSQAQVQQLRSGLWSTVISSVNNPGGEIRGRLTQRSNVSDFNGNGLNDFAFFRPMSSTWHVTNEDGISTQTFGEPNDRPVSGDYDGDGITDAAVYSLIGTRGFWNIRRSSDNGTTSIRFGNTTDIPVQGDFDGDGRLDVAVFRPAARGWLIIKSDNTGRMSPRLGMAGDIPVPADLDGDGKHDVVVYSPTEGTWSWIRSSDGVRGFKRWGVGTDLPVRGDFDGDGKGDLAFYRPSEGAWYSIKSSDGQIQSTQFGLPDDVPVAGKFDADGKTDLAVFRPSEGKWYVLSSVDGTIRTVDFGTIGDIPLNIR